MVRTSAIRILAGVVVGAVVLGGCGASVDKAGGDPGAGPVVLKVITTRASEEIQPFVDQVADVSNGSMSIALEADWHSGSVTGEAESIDAVRTGAADFAIVPVRAWHDAGVTSFDALIAPMVVDSYALQAAVLRDGMVDDMLRGVEASGLTGIGILPGPLRKPAGVTRELLAPSDFQGATIAISPSAVADRSLRALGASPVVSAFDGADMHPFDGLEQQISSIAGNEYDEVGTSVVGNISLWPRATVIVGNSSVVKALTDEQRRVLSTAARQAVGSETDVLLRSETEAVAFLCRRGRLTFLAASDDQRQELRDDLAPVNAWLAEDATTAGFLERIEAIRVRADVPAEPAPSCPGPTTTATMSAQPASGPTPLDGTYQMTTTQDDAAAFGLPVNGDSPANTGTFTWTFGGGVFTESQSNGPTQTWANGTYVVAGDTLTMTYVDGGGSGPGSDAHQRGGFIATWTWSLYHDTLAITWIDPTRSTAEYPANYAVKPWSRIGDAPGVLTPQTAPTTPN